MGGLVDDAFLLLLPGAIRSPQCAQGVPATRSGLLVCLPYQREPHPQALSRTNRDGDPGALRAGSTGTQQLALAFLSCTGASGAIVRAEGSAALHQALSSPSAHLAGGALSLAQRTGCGPHSSFDARLGLCRKWEDHAPLSMGSLFSAGRGPALAWLSLEALDNDLISFWASVIAALRTCLPRVGKTALAMLHSQEAPPLSTILTNLLNEFRQVRRELILVLDDYHVISDQIIHEAILFLIDHLHLDQPADIEKTLEWMALSVVALHHTGKRAQAARVAARLLAMTEPEGCIRLYLDAGEPMREALETLLEAVGKEGPDAPQKDENSASAVPFSRSYVSRLLVAFEQEERKRAHRAGPPLARKSEIEPEPLSRQELRVLHLLVSGQTYAEMAEALIVSPNTIKTQVSSIYRKLGVSRRAEAIAATTRLHLP